MDGILTPFDTGPAPEVAQASPGDSIGVVEVANGNSFITRTDGSKTSAKVGDAIFQGDTIETDAEGAIGILFSDDSVFSLAEEGHMVIDEMIYDPGTQDGSANFNIAAGVFTFVSGQIAKTGVDAMIVTTPSATIGIRGTAGAVRIGKDSPDSYTLLEEGGSNPAAIQGQAAGDTLLAQAPGDGGSQLGEMLITTNVGSRSLSQANATTFISGPFSSPSAIVILPASAILQAYASARNALPPSPFPINQNPDNTDQGGTEAGADAEGGPEDPNADETIDEAAQAAAADAFEEALAGGATLEEALTAAAGAATDSLLDSALAANPDLFGTAGSIDSVMNALLNLSMGGLGTEATNPLDGGFGDDDGPGGDDGGIFGLDGPGVFFGPDELGEFGDFGEFGEFFDFLPDLFNDPFDDPDDDEDVFFLGPEPGTPTVTTFTDELVSNSFTFVDSQNDILINDTANTNTSVSLFGGAEVGDFYQGGSYNDTLVFSTDTIQSLKVSDTTSINLSVFTFGTLVDLFFNGPSTTTLNTGPSGYGGDVLISDSTGDDQNWTILGGVDGSNNFMTILGGSGTDTVTLGSGTTNDLSLSGIETVDMGATSLTLKNEQSGTTFDAVTGSHLTLNGTDNTVSLAAGAVLGTLTGSSGTDTINLDASGGTLNNVEGIENIFGDAGVDTVTVIDSIGTLINTDAGDDTVTGGAGDDTITAGAGDDTITGGNGADILSGGTGNDTFIYSAASHFGDSITDFETGSLNDVIDFNVAVSGGSVFEQLNSGSLAGTTGVLAYFDGSLTGVAATDEGNIITALNTDITFGTGDSLLIAVGGGTANSSLWYWDDGGGNSDGTIDAGEFTLVTELDSVDVNQLVADNFEGFT